MDNLTFVVRIVEALSWPASTLALIVLFRKPILKILFSMHRVSLGGLEVEFRKLTDNLPASFMARAKVDRKLLKLASTSPRAAVLEAWISVEQALLDVGNRLAPTESRNPLQALRILGRSDLLGKEMAGKLQHMRHLRNEASHSPEFALSQQAALDYIKAAELATQFLQRLASEQPKDRLEVELYSEIR